MRARTIPHTLTWARLVAALVVATVIGGCAYENFNIIVGRDFYLGKVLSDYRDVEVGDKRILLKPGARISIETQLITQSVAQFELNILSGDGIVAYVRTVPNAFDTLKGIALHYSTSGCWVRTDDSVIVPIEYNADAGPQTLTVYTDGDLVRFDAGCRMLFESTTRLPATEHLIIEALPGSSVEIRAVKFFNDY